MTKQYNSVSEMVRAVAPDADTAAATEARIAGRKLIKHLIAMRALKEMSQNDIANILDCTQSRISKLERSLDNDVRLGDLRSYAKAVGCEICCCIPAQNLTPVDKVKGHLLTIKKHMDNLAELAKTDEKIAEGVVKFFAELLFNFARLFGDSVKQLPLAPNGLPYIDFRVAEECHCEDDQNAPLDSETSDRDSKERLATASP